MFANPVNRLDLFDVLNTGGILLVDTRPRHAEFEKNRDRVWGSAEVGGTVSVIDTQSHETVKKLSFEITGVHPELIQPMGIRFSKDGKLGFVALGPANRVAVVDTETYETQKYILVGQRQLPVSFRQLTSGLVCLEPA